VFSHFFSPETKVLPENIIVKKAATLESGMLTEGHSYSKYGLNGQLLFTLFCRGRTTKKNNLLKLIFSQKRILFAAYID
jgi:hypothetical protein